MAQRKRTGLITQGSEDRNLSSLDFFFSAITSFHSFCNPASVPFGIFFCLASSTVAIFSFRMRVRIPKPLLDRILARKVHDRSAGRRGRGSDSAGPRLSSNVDPSLMRSPGISITPEAPPKGMYDDLEETLKNSSREGLKPSYKLRDRDWTKFTKLEEDLHRIIEFRGAMPMHEYMRNALSHPIYGYYTCKDEVFGKGGDYITAPEISQMFGEMIAFWCILSWEAMGKPEKFNLVEFGPGKGTLMKDAMAMFRQVPDFMKAMNVHMIENSLTLQRKQRESLQVKFDDSLLKNAADLPQTIESETIDGVPAFWHTHFSCTPSGSPYIVFANEFFDAMPIFKFEYTLTGWHEICLDIHTSKDKGLKPVLVKTQAVHHFFPEPGSPAFKSKAIQVLSPPINPQLSDRIEICPMGLNVAQEIGKKIAQEGGVALVIDYGNDHAASDSLRAIRNHKIQNFLEDPGKCDLTADVDFAAMGRAFRCFEEEKYLVKTCGLVSQSSFLKTMGIEARKEMLKTEASTQKVKDDIQAEFIRLTDENDTSMGRSYKVLAAADSRMKFIHGCPIPLPVCDGN